MQQLLLALAPPPAPTLANFFPARNDALVAALAAFAGGGTPESPVMYLWGAPGSGRSHLLAATAQAVRAAGGTAAAVGGRERWPADTLDLVVADDVETLAAGEQIRLFDVFNRQRAAGARFLAAGNVPPGQLALREDLRTRLASGAIFEVAALTDEERLGALHAHAVDRGMHVSEDVFGYIARRVQRDMGTQMAVLDALDRYSLEHHRPLTLPLAREVLRSLGIAS